MVPLPGLAVHPNQYLLVHEKWWDADSVWRSSCGGSHSCPLIPPLSLQLRRPPRAGPGPSSLFNSFSLSDLGHFSPSCCICSYSLCTLAPIIPKFNLLDYDSVSFVTSSVSTLTTSNASWEMLPSHEDSVPASWSFLLRPWSPEHVSKHSTSQAVMSCCWSGALMKTQVLMGRSEA